MSCRIVRWGGIAWSIFEFWKVSCIHTYPFLILLDGFSRFIFVFWRPCFDILLFFRKQYFAFSISEFRKLLYTHSWFFICWGCKIYCCFSKTLFCHFLFFRKQSLQLHSILTWLCRGQIVGSYNTSLSHENSMLSQPTAFFCLKFSNADWASTFV